MRLARFVLLACGLALGGCMYVTLPAPLGEGPVRLEPGDWDGHWVLTPELVARVAVTDPQAGTIELSWMTRRPGESQIELAGAEATLRRVADVLVVSVRPRGQQRYAFAVLQRRGDRVTLWFPDPDCVRSQMDAGALRGERLRTHEDVELALLALDPVRAVSRDGPGCPFFAWDKPALARRITSVEN